MRQILEKFMHQNLEKFQISVTKFGTTRLCIKNARAQRINSQVGSLKPSRVP